MGLTEAHQVLAMNNLRGRVTLRTDGGLRTGRDIVMAAMMGAEEYGIGTAALIAMGCIMVRQCQSNTCPVGVCTQDERLRAKFTGTADKVVNLITFYAQEVREILAHIGARSMDEIIGRADLLTQVSRGRGASRRSRPEPAADPRRWRRQDRLRPHQAAQRGAGYAGRRDRRRCAAVPERRREDAAVLCGAEHPPHHRHAGLVSHIVQKFGMTQQAAARPSDGEADRLGRAVAGRLRGAGAEAGSVGRRQRLCRQGAVGRHASWCGRRCIRRWWPRDNTIIGNTVLYGATDGFLFAAGRAGERFAVRNSGAKVVIEGCGSNGCEYMTGGVAVILGADRRQLRRRDDRRHGLYLRSRRAWRLALHEPGDAGDLPGDGAALGSRAEGPDRAPRPRDDEPQGGRDPAPTGRWSGRHFIQICPKEMLVHLKHPLALEEGRMPAE